ncbi:unnamed protein product [Paramecium sonneborni]|uniref:Uncharacterized protein n=1 Tax=Paramecium sonneborni TaxID=65129 RepID=A0A8S1N010_9CILI|nr:unnamed protein product [Paramecium sonneborni]
MKMKTLKISQQDQLIKILKQIQNMSLESQVLLALWELYQQNQISMEQKGCIKDLLIRKDYNFYSAISNCQKLDQLEKKLLDILNCKDLQILF